MKRIVFLKLAVAFVMALMLVVPHQSLAVRAPDEDTTMTRVQINLAPKLGLRSILIRDLNQSVTGDFGRAAKGIVESLINPQVSDEQQSLSRDGLTLSNDLKIIGFEAQLRKTQVDSLGYTHIRMTQHYQGLPVVGAEIIVHINDRDVLYQINGKYLPAVKVSIEPSIGANDALQIGLDEQQGKAGVYVSKEPSLVIFGGHLAYHYVISHEGEEVGQWWYYVDAHTGKLIYRYNNIQYAAPDETKGTHTTVEGDRLTGEDGSHVSMTGFYENAGSGTYFLYNFDDVWGIYDEDVPDWEQNTTSNWGTSDRAAISAGNNFEDTQDYVLTVLGRDSFNDAGAFARGNVHTGTNYVNAYWDGTDFHFGDGDGVTANALTVLDVAAHEYGHAITDYTSDLIYSYESGALNESYSDIMGALVEFAYQPDGTGSYPDATPGYSDWLIGEDCWLPDPGDALRNLREPQRYQQPSYYHGTHWYSGSGDNGGVHTNSGVQNFAFYLLAEGGDGVNDGHPYGPITGLGIAGAGEVAMYANMYLLTPSSQYVDSRQAWIDAAAVFGYPTATVEQVWAAVGVGDGPGGECSLINDGSFENGPPPASAWTEWSSSGYEWIINPTLVWGIPSYNGDYAFWAGGYYNRNPNSDYVEQIIDIPSGATSLKFMTNFYRPDDADPPNDDTFEVKVNGTPIFTRGMVQANNTYPNWEEQVVDISAYAGQSVTLRFEGTSTGSLTGNVLVDYITICAEGAEGATIYGTVTGMISGSPIGNAHIIAWHEDGATLERTRTNFSGYYELTDLKAGKWRMRAVKSGYKGGWPRFVDVSPGGNYEENFTLFRLSR